MEQKASSIPDSVDAGDMTEYLLQITADLMSTASRIVDQAAEAERAVDMIAISSQYTDEEFEVEFASLKSELDS